MSENKQSKSWVRAAMKYLVPLIITIGLCWLLFTNEDLRQMKTILLNNCDYRWLGLAMFISIFSHVFRAMRWGIQLKALDIRAPLHALIYSIFGTYAVNLVFPRLGEVWRTGYIAERQDAPFPKVFGSMVADRLADTLTVLIIFAVTFLLASNRIIAYLVQNAGTYAGIMALLRSPWLWLAILAMVAFAWWFFTRKTQNRLVCRVQEFCRGLWRGFAVILHMPGKGRWLLLTVLLWGCYFVQLYVAFYAFPFTEAVLSQYGIVAVLVTFVLSSISMGVPSNGGIGPWQWAVMIALSMYGLPDGLGKVFGTAVLGSQTLMLIALGIFTFIAIALDKKRLKRKTAIK